MSRKFVPHGIFSFVLIAYHNAKEISIKTFSGNVSCHKSHLNIITILKTRLLKLLVYIMYPIHIYIKIILYVVYIIVMLCNVVHVQQKRKLLCSLYEFTIIVFEYLMQLLRLCVKHFGIILVVLLLFNAAYIWYFKDFFTNSSLIDGSNNYLFRRLYFSLFGLGKICGRVSYSLQ